MTSILASLLVLVGLTAMAWGVRTVFGPARPRALIAVIVAPVGLLLALVGALWLFVPGFFG